MTTAGKLAEGPITSLRFTFTVLTMDLNYESFPLKRARYRQEVISRFEVNHSLQFDSFLDLSIARFPVNNNFLMRSYRRTFRHLLCFKHFLPAIRGTPKAEQRHNQLVGAITDYCMIPNIRYIGTWHRKSEFHLFLGDAGSPNNLSILHKQLFSVRNV